MILTLHRRYPEGDHWEIDPNPLGTICYENGTVKLEMDDCPIKTQIQKVLSRPITFIDGLFSDEGEPTVLKTVNIESDDYTDALVSELRRFGIEARRRVPAIV